MACCAFAVFLLGQVYLLVTGVRERIFGAAPLRAGGAATWRAGLPAGPVAAPGASWWGRNRQRLVGGTSLAALGLAVTALWIGGPERTIAAVALYCGAGPAAG